MVINILGLMYIIFVLEEVKPRAKDDIEDQSTVTELTDMLNKRQSREDHATTAIESTTSQKCLNAIKDCVMVIVRKRSGHGRKIVCLTLAIAGLIQALEYGMTPTKINFL